MKSYPLEMTADENVKVARERIGLCFDCHQAKLVESARGSEFYFCGLSATDPQFPKYPRLPVASCSGYTPKSQRC